MIKRNNEESLISEVDMSDFIKMHYDKLNNDKTFLKKHIMT